MSVPPELVFTRLGPGAAEMISLKAHFSALFYVAASGPNPSTTINKYCAGLLAIPSPAVKTIYKFQMKTKETDVSLYSSSGKFAIERRSS